jgi:multicomponent K+:H+ antiporter subunit E
MSGWRFRPALSGALLVLWLLLANSLALGQVLLGGLLALVIPRLTDAFWPARPRTCHAVRLLRFTATVLADIVRANLIVARLILGPPAALRPAFVEVPLDLEDDLAIAVFASTVSLTPGTVSASLSSDRRTLLVHGLDVADDRALVETLKRRYEAPIKEILECSS